MLVAELVKACEALLEIRPGARPVSLLGRGHPEREHGVGGAPGITNLAMQRERLLAPQPGRRGISRADGHHGRSVQRPGAGRSAIRVDLEKALQARPALREVAPEVPEPVERSGQLQGELGFAGGFQPVESRAEVVVFAFESLDPFRWAFAEMRIRVFGERQEPLRVPAAQRITVAGDLEPLGRVLADGLQHPETLFALPEQALLDERLERVHIGIRHLLGGFERAAAAEDGEPREQVSLFGREQVVRPLDRRAQRLVASFGVAASLEQVEPL